MSTSHFRKLNKLLCCIFIIQIHNKNMATEKCLEEIVTKYSATIGCEELTCPEDKIICIVNYVQYSEEASESYSFPERIYYTFYYLLGTIKESNRDMVLQQCVYQLIFILHLKLEIEDELVSILFGKDNEHLLEGRCLFNNSYSTDAQIKRMGYRWRK